MEEILTILTERGITTFLVILLIIATSWWYLTMPKGIPPGPLGLPVVGYMPFLGKVPHTTVTKLGKKYGSVFRFYLGSRLVVILNDYKAIYEAFVKLGDVFHGRPDEMQNLFAVEDFNNIAASDGEFWRDHRRFALVLLRDCGVGKLSIEPRMTEEIQYFLNELKQHSGKCIDIRDMLSISIANNICIMALGKRFNYEDEEFLQIKHSMDQAVMSTGTLSIMSFYPWLKHVPGIQRVLNFEKLHKLMAHVDKFLEKIRQEHKAAYIDGQREHYVNAYFTEQKARSQKLKEKDNIFTDRALLNNMRTLLGAGTETTTNTLLWGIIHMMRHPDIQKKVQEELDLVIGSERSPSWNDRLRTPYTEATVFEIQRMGNIIPLNLPHRNKAECELLGYTIPRDSFILTNLGNVLNDPKLWGDPENFRPERFINDKGEVERPDFFIPFSIGKRQCLGEMLARMELYLYFTSMLQKFTFKSPGGDPPSLDRIIGLTNFPTSTTTCPISRHT